MNGHHVATIAALIAMHAQSTAAFAVVLASAPLLMSDFRLSQTEFGLLVSAFYVGQVALAIPSGRIVDRIGVQHGLSVAVVSAVGCLSFLAVASNGASAGAAMLLLGVSVMCPQK